jgi:hypothetical protein
MSKEREILEKQENKKLKDYKYLDHNNLKSDVLKKGYFIRYIKKATTNKPAHVVLGGKINDIIENNGIIERLKIKINTGKTFILKVKDNNNIFLYYKEKKVAEQRKIEAIQWVKQLTPYERKKMINMKKMILV